jgi:5-(carboxyamino)imidazole ribonucleotide synthase
MKQVCVLGNGQLGRMLRQAGEPLGIAVWPVGLEAEPEAVPFQQSVITAEIERWPETALTRELARHNAFVNRDVFPIIADRLTQKQLFDKLGLATAPWQLLADKSEWPTVFAMLGELAIVKRRVGGYDGRGQWRCAQTKPPNCRMIATASASLSRASTLAAKCRWLARARMTAAPCSIR